MHSKYRIVPNIARTALLAGAWAVAAAAFAAPDAAPPSAAAASAAAPSAAASPAAAPPADAPGAPAMGAAAPPADFKTLDQEVQGLKKDVIDLNKDLFVLEEELLFPANTQVALYVSMDVGSFFALDSVTVKIDNKEVKSYLYTAREADALLKGGVQQIYLATSKSASMNWWRFLRARVPWSVITSAAPR